MGWDFTAGATKQEIVSQAIDPGFYGTSTKVIDAEQKQAGQGLCPVCIETIN